MDSDSIYHVFDQTYAIAIRCADVRCAGADTCDPFRHSAVAAGREELQQHHHHHDGEDGAPGARARGGARARARAPGARPRGAAGAPAGAHAPAAPAAGRRAHTHAHAPARRRGALPPHASLPSPQTRQSGLRLRLE